MNDQERWDRIIGVKAENAFCHDCPNRGECAKPEVECTKARKAIAKTKTDN